MLLWVLEYRSQSPDRFTDEEPYVKDWTQGSITWDPELAPEVESPAFFTTEEAAYRIMELIQENITPEWCYTYRVRLFASFEPIPVEQILKHGVPFNSDSQ